MFIEVWGDFFHDFPAMFDDTCRLKKSCIEGRRLNHTRLSATKIRCRCALSGDNLQLVGDLEHFSISWE